VTGFRYLLYILIADAIIWSMFYPVNPLARPQGLNRAVVAIVVADIAILIMLGARAAYQRIRR